MIVVRDIAHGRMPVSQIRGTDDAFNVVVFSPMETVNTALTRTDISTHYLT